jgi:hypothetical protein
MLKLPGISKLLSGNVVAYSLMGLAIAIGILTRIISLFQYTTFDIGPAPDQIRDAFVYMGMMEGDFPTLGQASSAGGYNLPPLYYYLVFPFVQLGANPALQVLPNGIFSFLAIPLFIVLVYELLENLPASKRLLLAGLAGFWYSLIFSEIFVSTFEWNPSPIPFFLFTFLLLYKRQLARWAPLPIQAAQWILYGVVLAILVSLHSTTLFVMPIVFVGSIIVFLVKNRKHPHQWVFPGLAIASSIIALTPYWIGEISRRGSNTKKIIALILNRDESASSAGIFDRLSRIVFNYLELGQQTFFTKFPWFYGIGTIILALILVLGISRFKGNRSLWISLLSVWLVYLYAASNYDRDYVIHYKRLLFFAPILLAVSSLAYVDKKPKLVHRFITGLIAVSITLSCVSNLYFNYWYLDSKFGQHQAIAISDVISILNSLPTGSTLCDPKFVRWRTQHHVVQYLDTYITQQEMQLSEVCQPGNYLIYPKFQYAFLDNNRWPQFNLVHAKPFDKAAKLVLETPAAQVYQIETPYYLNDCYSFVGEPRRVCVDQQPNAFSS